jgi:hypothetical protein
MATIKKILNAKDVFSARSITHEYIPITGSVVSGTYADPTLANSNIRRYSHGMFESTYDYPFSSASSNHLCDITFGVYGDSTIAPLVITGSGTSATNQADAKKNIYAEMAAILVGVDETGSVRPFDRLGNFGTTTVTNKMNTAYFVNFSRLLTKDGIQEGSFELLFSTGSLWGAAHGAAGGTPVRISDSGSVTQNSVAGEYRVLYSASAGESLNDTKAVGLLYKQYGVAVLELSSSVITGCLDNNDQLVSSSLHEYLTYGPASTTASINELGAGFRNRWKNLTFNNNVEINSTIYNCYGAPHEFNYSSNPTYVDATGSIRTRLSPNNTPSYNEDLKVYITSVGLYDSKGTLLAVGKISEPVEKRPSNDFTVRLRLDY